MANYNERPYNNRPQNSRPQGGYQNKTQVSEKPYVALDKETYVQRAESVIKKLEGNKLTTSQIRNILSMLNQMYTDVITTTEPVLSEEIQAKKETERAKKAIFIFQTKKKSLFLI